LESVNRDIYRDQYVTVQAATVLDTSVTYGVFEIVFQKAYRDIDKFAESYNRDIYIAINMSQLQIV